MKDAQVSIAPFRCQLVDLAAFSHAKSTDATPIAETIFSQDEPLFFRVTVGFEGSGAIALLALNPTIQVDFFGNPFGKGNEIELGSIAVETIPHQLTYTPTLHLKKGIGSVVFSPGAVYKITALMRAGVPEYPALIIGFIEGLTLQTYSHPT